ncbi:MAG: hypothetical protein BMS9Abin02_1788 [Anaerolineae bacterium]|nr:MAG: hypothetical protein BMS9Abin02_1788 [Anaerolineae bacterium]
MGLLLHPVGKGFPLSRNHFDRFGFRDFLGLAQHCPTFTKQSLEPSNPTETAELFRGTGRLIEFDCQEKNLFKVLAGLIGLAVI